jgi:phospholipase C
VFYIRGGYQNQMGLTPHTTPATPAAEKAAIEASKAGDDDHPGYSDRQLSEAMAARVINTIAGNPQLWAHSAIIITYDESDGFYDHVPPRILSYGPDGLPLARGIRVPLILISPYARTHAVSHAEGDHNAVIETINAIFDLPPLASLPEEKQALKDGDSAAFNRFGPPGFRQKALGPRDIRSPISDSLLSGFDPQRLRGVKPPLPASYATIDESVVTTLPHYGGQGCKALNITPVAPPSDNDVPAGFNPLPSTYPAAN